MKTILFAIMLSFSLVFLFSCEKPDECKCKTDTFMHDTLLGTMDTISATSITEITSGKCSRLTRVDTTVEQSTVMIKVVYCEDR